MIKPRIVAVIMIGIILESCNGGGDNEKSEIPLARAGDKTLYLHDLPGDVTIRARGKDSIPLIKMYVNDWLKQQLMVQNALDNTGEPSGINQKVEAYRSSLIIYEYQKRWLAESLDTSVSHQEIVDYYTDNQKNFELKENIVRMHYVKLPVTAPEIQKAKRWFLSSDPEDRLTLLEYCNKNAVNTFFDEDSWLSFGDLLKEIPLKNYDEETFLSSNKFIELKDDEYIYWIHILSFRVKSDVSPLELEIARIRNILINKRKLKLLQELEASLLKDAKEKNTIEWYID